MQLTDPGCGRPARRPVAAGRSSRRELSAPGRLNAAVPQDQALSTPGAASQDRHRQAPSGWRREPSTQRAAQAERLRGGEGGITRPLLADLGGVRWPIGGPAARPLGGQDPVAAEQRVQGTSGQPPCTAPRVRDRPAMAGGSPRPRPVFQRFLRSARGPVQLELSNSCFMRCSVPCICTNIISGVRPNWLSWLRSCSTVRRA